MLQPWRARAARRRRREGPGEPFDPPEVQWTRVSGRLAGARRVVTCGPLLLVGAALVALALTAGPGWLVWTALVPLAVAVWAWWTIGRQVRSWGYAERADDLLVRHGMMFRTVVVVPYGRMQYVDVNAGPVARMFGSPRCSCTRRPPAERLHPRAAPQRPPGCVTGWPPAARPGWRGCDRPAARPPRHARRWRTVGGAGCTR